VLGGDNKRRAFHLLVLAILTVSTLVIAPFLTSSPSGQQSWWSRGVWIVAGIIVYFLYLWWQARSPAGSPEAINERVSKLATALREQVRIRSYGARRRLIEAPLRELLTST